MVQETCRFVETAVSDRVRAEAGWGRYFVWEPFTLWPPVGGVDDNWSLQFSALPGTTAVGAAVESRGHEATGYFWRGVARYLVGTEAPELADNFEYDPEAEIFAADGDRASLLRLSAIIRPAVTDPAAVVSVIDAAIAAGFELDP